MKSYILLSLIIFSTAFSQAQTFNGTGGSIPGTSTTRTCFNITVTGVGVINSTNGLAQVCMNITHPNDDELEIVLIAPDGKVVPLTVQNGGTGNNYTSTCFSSTATTSIKSGTAPFTGSFIPEGYLGAVNNGQNANGAWSLCIQDRRTVGNAGTLVNWSITFSNTPAPIPPTLPGCSATLPGTSSCSNATNVCDFNGLCGNTSGTTVQDWTGSGLNACFGLENNSFVKFVASSTSASFSVWVPTTTTGGYNTAGIQMLFFSGTCNSGAVTTYGCYPHIYPYPSVNNPLITIVNGTGFTPGNIYYLMIDGFNGDKCTFTIAANSGVNILNISPVAPTICAGGSVNLTASGGNGVYSWAPPAGLNTTSGSVVTATPASSITYTVTSSTFGSCPMTKDVIVTVNTVPSAPVLTVVNNCGSSTITATGVTGTLIWSDGGSGNPRTITTAGTFTVTQTLGACTSAISNSVTTAPAAVPSAPTASVSVQPTCSISSGTIVITAPTGANLEYSINGTTYQASTTFNAVVPGSYAVIVRNTTTTCISNTTSVTVNAVPAKPATPTASVTVPPSCSISTGTIVITAPTGINLEYSINGTSFQSSTIFNTVTPGTYLISVRNTSSTCISNTSSVTVNAAPLTAVSPTASVTVQPSCSIQTGTILITAPTGPNLEYSINGITYQSNMLYTGLNSGTYAISARFTGSGCSSTPVPLIVSAFNINLCRNEIYFPSAFTPNSDGINDEFGPGPLSNLSGISEYSLHIYNRYGQLVFKSNDPYLKWDGKFKGRLLGNNTYVWQANYKKANGIKDFQKGSVFILK